MLSISALNISKSFGTNTVIKNASFAIHEKDRIGIVGVNGSGKTTLMKIIAGYDFPDTGELTVAKNTKIGYLAQQDMILSERSVWNELETVFEPVLKMEKRLRSLEIEMERVHTNTNAFKQITTEYDQLFEKFKEADGYSWRSLITGVLNGLGFDSTMCNQSISELSGGERTRLYIGKLLLEKPEILLLDEPTNHLDMDSLQWLENYLISYKGTVVIISHDRYFLDHLCNGIIEVINGYTEMYNGNYSNYISQRAQIYFARMRSYELQQKEIARQQSIIMRYRMYNREKSVKAADSREKALKKMQLIEKPNDEKKIHFSFKCKRRSGDDALIIKNISKSYDNKTLFKNIDLCIRSGEKIAIIGPNGIGKSTFLKIIAKMIEADTGSVTYGSNVDIGYFDQHQSTLHENKSVLDEVWDRFPNIDQTTIRSVLGLFLFSEEDVFQPIYTLSGGEKGRVALACLMLEENNVLLLDEPTNHLDMDSREILETSLSLFQGTIITVSHDRFFINQIADRIIEIKDNTITTYLGNYDDYLIKKNSVSEEIFVNGKTKTMLNKEKKKDRMQQQLLKQKKLKIKHIEQQISNLELEIGELEMQMSDPSLYSIPENIENTNKKYTHLKNKLSDLYNQWEISESILSE